jgi:serine/threonine-protein kinase
LASTSPGPQPPLKPGELLGGYRVLRHLGDGGTATVFLAEDEAGAPVALKVLSLSALGGRPAETAQHFQTEAALVRQLQHPCIAQVLAAGVQGPWAWIAMEAAPGVALSRYTAAKRLLPEPVVLHMGQQIAQALACAHAQGVVHRDIKPANVIVAVSTGSLKVTDFGLARFAGAQRTGTGIVLGSPAFLAPELLAGGEASPAGDLYALGVTLFQLLTGRLPLDAPSLGELLRRVSLDTAPTLQSLRPDLPAGLSALLAALLAKQPAQRPPHALAVSAELAAWAA